LEVVTTREGLRTAVAHARRTGARIGLVPTMGYLHEGHLRLVDRAARLTDFVVASVFVNPLQFGPAEDLDRYPRDLDRDAELARGRGVHLLFAPDAAEMYPPGSSGVLVTAPVLGQRLCGAFRPGHFDGVLTVVAKLLNLVQPDTAVFGGKDFQQAVLIRRMARALDFPVAIEIEPTVREADGLAMSSRNVRLGPAAREQALALSRGLHAAQAAFAAGETDAAALVAVVRRALDAAADVRAQYVKAVDAETLDDVDFARAGCVLAVAAFVGDTRLIDNHVLT
jgi:pantoate--beta-alanine ligase